MDYLLADTKIYSEQQIKDFDKFAVKSEITFLKLDKIGEDWRNCLRVDAHNRGIIQIDESVSKLLFQVQQNSIKSHIL